MNKYEAMAKEAMARLNNTRIHGLTDEQIAELSQDAGPAMTSLLKTAKLTSMNLELQGELNAKMTKALHDACLLILVMANKVEFGKVIGDDDDVLEEITKSRKFSLDFIRRWAQLTEWAYRDVPKEPKH